MKLKLPTEIISFSPFPRRNSVFLLLPCKRPSIVLDRLLPFSSLPRPPEFFPEPGRHGGQPSGYLPCTDRRDSHFPQQERFPHRRMQSGIPRRPLAGHVPYPSLLCQTQTGPLERHGVAEEKEETSPPSAWQARLSAVPLNAHWPGLTRLEVTPPPPHTNLDLAVSDPAVHSSKGLGPTFGLSMLLGGRISHPGPAI